MVEDGIKAIEARNLSKSFKGRVVLRDASLTLPTGEALVLQGENGAGKTTLLRILSTVVRPDGGNARVAGFDLRREAPRVRTQIGVAFVNERSVYWRLSPRENLMLFAATRGVAAGDRRTQIDSIAAELGMTAFLDRRIGELSTGQRQRIMLARAGLGNPSVLLIDEPLRGLDEPGVEDTIAFIRRRLADGAAALIAAPTVTELRGRDFGLIRLLDGCLVPTAW